MLVTLVVHQNILLISFIRLGLWLFIDVKTKHNQICGCHDDFRDFIEEGWRGTDMDCRLLSESNEENHEKDNISANNLI
jgi:hypothetical protein